MGRLSEDKFQGTNTKELLFFFIYSILEKKQFYRWYGKHLLILFVRINRHQFNKHVLNIRDVYNTLVDL